MRREPYTLEFVPDHFKTQEMCHIAVETDTYTLEFVPEHLKTQETCIKAVEADPWQLHDVPDWFVMLEERV